MNELQTFVNSQFGEIRIVQVNNEPYFVGKDIANALGYCETNSMTKRLDKEDFISAKMEGMNMNSIFINESGLYNAIFGSKLPSAKQFKRWVTTEVLPQIRKTGGYIPTDTQDDELTIMAKAHRILERTLVEKNNLIIAQSRQLAEAQPKAERYDRLINVDGFYSFNVVAKELGVGRNKLMSLLRKKGILFRDGYSNIAYQRYCDQGYFVVKHSIGRNGYPCGVTKVTPKGLEFLCKLLYEYDVA